jgi:hypothetical protein
MQHFAKLFRSVLLCVFSVFLFHDGFSQVDVSSGTYSESFDAVGTGLPNGWTVRTGATASVLGTAQQTFATAANTWSNTTGGFKNLASADGLTSSSSATVQNGSTDRVVALRPTGSIGDPGGAFVLQLANTTGLSNIQIGFKIQSLDITSARTMNWIVDYGIGATPTAFTQISSGTYSTGGSSFSNNTITITNAIPAGNASNIWIRIVALTTSTGSGNRPTVGIDDFTLTASTNIPNLSASATAISGFNYAEGSGPSNSISYNLTGSNLSPASGDITVTAPTNFEVSTSAAGTFTDNLLVPYTSGTLASTPIFVRLKLGLLTGTYGGTGINVTNTLGALNANVNVRGTVSCGAATDISIIRASVPVPVVTPPPSFTAAGTVTAVFGTGKFYIQDATGGIAVFATNIVSTNSIVLGDQIRITGTPVRFNGEAQINNITCFLKTGTGSVPAPIEFNPTTTSLNAFMCANEGSFVKIPSANFTSTGTFTTGSTGSGNNYSIVPCNAQDITEIRVDPNSGTLIGANIPTVAQDIIGVLGRFVNTSTDKLQLFPRNLSDLSASATSCASPSTCGVTTFTDSPTKLDIVNWNIEWLGHPSSSNGPSNKALQQTNAQTVINGIGADVYMLQEICQYNPANPNDNTTSFGKLIEGLNTTFGANTYSGECSAAVSTTGGDPNPQRVCIIYKNSVVTKVFSRPMFSNFTPTTYPPTGMPSNFWASGRKPFMFMAKVNINAQTDTILFVGLHAKAGSALDDYARRQFDAKAMYDTLQAQYSSRKTIILGDMNDDFDKSIASSGCTQRLSSYSPFLYANPNETLLNGTRPNADWVPISKVFSDVFCASTAGFPDYIDHQLVSNEMVGTSLGYRYEPASVASLRPTITDYATTTSDHYATVARYEYIAPPVITSIVPTGNWSSPSTWSCNCVPTSADNVVIETGHTITVDAASQAKSLNLKGTLNYVSAFTLSLGM